MIFKYLSVFSILFWIQANAFSNDLHTIIEDDIHFDLKWPGNLINNDLSSNMDSIEVKTLRNENFKCILPTDKNDNDLDELDRLRKLQIENSIETIKLFEAFYDKKICSYRIESYWIYELCHGHFVRQYHETKQTGKAFVVEYFLGYYNLNHIEADYIKDNDGKLRPNIHWKQLDGKNVPMYAVKYQDGTKCDILNNKPREITVFYACEENGNENIVGLEEISSCIYEMIVVTKIICDHPAYKLPEKSKKTISCFSNENSLQTKPKDLLLFETNKDTLLKSSQNRVQMTNRDGETFIIHYKAIDSKDSATVTDDSTTDESEQDAESSSTKNPYTQSQLPYQQSNYVNQPAMSGEAEKEMIASFLSGSSCLTGGVGWWKYEVCLGKHVNQFHEDEVTKKRASIQLGLWDKYGHLDWLKSHPNKRPLANKSERTTITLYFSNGDRCEENGKARFVEVKLRCLRNKEKSYAVSLYLLEPMTCEYILTVESTWLCDYIESVDMNALVASAYKEEDQNNQSQEPSSSNLNKQQKP